MILPLTQWEKKFLLATSKLAHMYRLMGNIFYNDYALSQILPYVKAASKQVMVNDSGSQLVMVNATHGDYVFYIGTKDNGDKRWLTDNAAWELTRALSHMSWNYFEPEDHWEVPDGTKQYLEGLEY